MRIGVVGAGLQANRRLAALTEHDELVAITSPDLVANQALAARFGGVVVPDWQALVEREDIEAVVVATPPHVHEPISIAALAAGKHVLCEKPLAVSSAAAARMEHAATAAQRVLHCGFNHRFHPAVQRLRELLRDGSLGRPLSAVAVYGHGVRDGYADEWRCDPSVVSGGQLMEQGIHVVDLISTLLWPVDQVVAHLQHSFGLPDGIEDDAHVLLRSESGQVAFLRSSLSQWQNRFSLDVTCERGTLRLNGLGGSYGEESLTVDSRTPGPFEERRFLFRGGDPSWRAEWSYFSALVADSPASAPDPAGRISLAVVEAAYLSAATGQWITVSKESP